MYLCVFPGIKVLTATMFTTPKILVRTPDEMTIRQKEVPRESWLVASLFRFPRIDTPRMIMRTPRVTKPELGDKSGQLRAM